MSEGSVAEVEIEKGPAGPVEARVPAETSGQQFDLADVEDPTASIRKAQELVQHMADQCSGPEYVANIQGKRYPKVDWWTTVGASLGLFPREENIRRLDRDHEVAYEATVGVYSGQDLVTRGSAICSDAEPTWSGRDEYAIRSMALTRATGKAFRLGLSFLPVMAGMEPTPAEEMPRSPDPDDWSPEDRVGFGKHSGLTWKELAEQEPGYCDWILDNDVDKAPEPAKDYIAGVLTEQDAEAENPDLKASDDTLDAIGEALQELQGWDKSKATEISEWYSEHQEKVEGSQDRAETVLARIEDRIEEAKEDVEAATEQKEAL